MSVTAPWLSRFWAERYRRGMTYAQGRTFYDADSHIMELPHWLVEYADADVRDRLRPLYLGAAGKLADNAMRDAETRAIDPSAGAALESDVLHHKGWSALGAFDPVERTRALDLLGFDCQLVFSTFAPTQFLGDDPDLVYGGTRAHNRGMVDFCSDDPRLVPVGFVPWGSPEQNARGRRGGDRPRLRCSAAAVGARSQSSRRPPIPTTIPCGARSRRTTSRSCSTSAAAGD